jgi:tetratricopeptide (TPR) repeat protein
MRRFEWVACLAAIAILAACSNSDAPSRDAVDNADATEESTTTATATSDGGIPLSSPNDAATAMYMEVRRLADKGDFIEANQAARKLTENHPDFAGAWVMLGNTSLSGSQFAQATTKALETAADGTEGERLWAAINMSFISNDTKEGLRLSKLLVDTYPESPRAWNVYSGYLTFQNQHDDARAAAAKVVALAPDQAFGHNTLGFSYLNNEPKDFALALQHFGHAAAIDPEEDNVRVNIGDVHRALGDLEASRDDYSDALDLDPNNSTAAVKRGHVNSFLGNYDEARADYDRGIASGQEGNQSTLANYRAFVSIHAGDHEAAVEELKGELERLDTLDIPADQKVGARNFMLINLTDICFENEMLDEAASAVDRLAATNADAAERSGDADFARQQDINTVFWRGKLAARQGNYDVALGHASTFERLAADESNPRKMERYYELLGLIALRQGEHAQAIEHYRKANLSTSPGGGDVKNIFMLATALLAEGEKAEATELMQKVANWNFNSVWFAMLRDKAAGSSS